jgi:hypothetical protein
MGDNACYDIVVMERIRSEVCKVWAPETCGYKVHCSMAQSAACVGWLWATGHNRVD